MVKRDNKGKEKSASLVRRVKTAFFLPFVSIELDSLLIRSPLVEAVTEFPMIDTVETTLPVAIDPTWEKKEKRSMSDEVLRGDETKGWERTRNSVTTNAFVTSEDDVRARVDLMWEE